MTGVQAGEGDSAGVKGLRGGSAGRGQPSPIVARKSPAVDDQHPGPGSTPGARDPLVARGHPHQGARALSDTSLTPPTPAGGPGSPTRDTSLSRPAGGDASARLGPGDVSALEPDVDRATDRCVVCGERLAIGLRPGALYCSKRCRQAASRRRLKTRPPVPTPQRRERCAWCDQPIAVAGRRVESMFCSKRWQASWRFGAVVASDASSRTSPERSWG